MPYQSGEIPEVGDKVRHTNGRPGVITEVHLNQGHLRGEDQVSVKWDDGGVGVGVALAREFTFISNPDSYHFIAECPQCKGSRSASCSRSQAATGDAIAVYAIQCDHSWKLTPEQSNKLRETLASLPGA